jgi:hypothetical protein
MTLQQKRRLDRLYQQKHRGSACSYVTTIENLQILLALEAGHLSEGQAMKALSAHRIEVREMRANAINAGVGILAPPREGEEVEE